MTPTPVLSAQRKLADRAREQRRERRRSLARRAAWVLAALAPFVLVGWLLLASPWLVVHRVVVSGEHRLTESEVLAAADVAEGTPLARVDTAAVVRRLRALGPVASVSVTRGWPRTLRISVVERQPVAAVAQTGGYALYDGTGVRLGTSRALPAGTVRLFVRAPGPDDAATRAALAVLQSLPRAVRVLVTAVRADTAEQVTLALTGKRTVVWGGTAHSREKGAALVPLLRLGGHVFDVSSPTVVTRR